ncbi:MAG: HTH domain-containing protein [Ruminococcaceae bacterium]|nr:HTH domain-containing protein [Oscillospiraceae bacterium]
MGAEQRKIEILRVLCLRKYDTISNLAKEFGVSKSTIQRDIIELGVTKPIYTGSGKYIGGVYMIDK